MLIASNSKCYILICYLQYEDHRRKWDTEEYQKLADKRLQEEYIKSDCKLIKNIFNSY